ncbi:MAG: hypothetical protein Q4Q21_08625 [Lachnospiraceae bacterium]|nr:hypothetical protein [Lachnospiraceae bacterium]
MVETVSFTGSEALAEELELSLLDGEKAFLHGTVASLSRTDSFEQILTHPAGREQQLTLRLHLRKEATNAVAGNTLTLSICFSGTDAPLQERPPEETEKPPETETPTETQKPPGTAEPEETMKPPPSSGAGTQDVENASDGRPSGGSQAGGGGHGGTSIRGEGYDGKTHGLHAEDPPGTLMDQLMEWIDRIYEHPENLVETAARPYGAAEKHPAELSGMASKPDVSGISKPSTEGRKYTKKELPETRRKAAGAGAERNFSAAESAGKKEHEKKNGTTNDGGNARLALRIRDVSPKHASVQISTEGGSGTIQDPVTLYIGPTQREKVLLVTCLFLFILLLILIIIKCWLLYRATQSENQEDSAYASTEQSV